MIFNGGNGPDNYLGTFDDDTIFGNGGEDYLEGGSGSDSVYGGARDDILTSYDALSLSLLDGDGFDDFLYGGAGNDELRGDADTDFLYGGDGNDKLRSNGGDDDVFGGNGNDDIDGGDGRDYVYGGAGNDRITGGFNGDVVYGGAGRDTFYFAKIQGSLPGDRDVFRGEMGVAAFENPGNAVGDKFDLQGIDANTTIGGNQTFIFGGTGKGHLWLTNSGTNTVVNANIDNDAAAEFVFEIEDGAGVLASAYTAADFVL